MTAEEDKDIATVREVLVYANDFVRVFNDEVRLPTGALGRHVRILPGDDATPVVLVVCHEGKVAVVLTSRYPARHQLWGLPRGIGQHQDPLVTAARELLEETGGHSNDLHVVGHLYPDSGLLGTRVAVVAGSLVGPPGPRADVDEVRAVDWLRPDQLTALIAAGEIEDGITLAAWALVQAQGETKR